MRSEVSFSGFHFSSKKSTEVIFTYVVLKKEIALSMIQALIHHLHPCNTRHRKPKMKNKPLLLPCYDHFLLLMFSGDPRLLLLEAEFEQRLMWKIFTRDQHLGERKEAQKDRAEEEFSGKASKALLRCEERQRLVQLVLQWLWFGISHRPDCGFGAVERLDFNQVMSDVCGFKGPWRRCQLGAACGQCYWPRDNVLPLGGKPPFSPRILAVSDFEE